MGLIMLYYVNFAQIPNSFLVLFRSRLKCVSDLYEFCASREPNDIK